MQRFRGGLVFKAHRLLNHLTPFSSLEWYEVGKWWAVLMRSFFPEDAVRPLSRERKALAEPRASVGTG